MKNLFLSLILLSISFSGVNAQTIVIDSSISTKEYAFLKKDKAINLSVDILNAYDGVLSLLNLDINLMKSEPTIHLGYEFGIEDQLSIEGLIAYNDITTNVGYSYYDLLILGAPTDQSELISLIKSQECMSNSNMCLATTTEKISIYTIGGKLRYHESIIKNLDTYVSINFGYNVINRETTIDPLISSFVDEESIDIFVPRFTYFAGLGLRYFILSKFGLWAEYGFRRKHHLNFGISYKL